jgi:hypothetical protein
VKELIASGRARDRASAVKIIARTDKNMHRNYLEATNPKSAGRVA